jgi:hypothetical protein
MANYREHGFMGVIAKPYLTEELCKVVQNVLDEEKRPVFV